VARCFAGPIPIFFGACDQHEHFKWILNAEILTRVTAVDTDGFQIGLSSVEANFTSLKEFMQPT